MSDLTTKEGREAARALCVDYGQHIEPARAALTRLPQLDALRGASALAVVVYHLVVMQSEPTGLLWLYAAQMWVAVPVFFVLSGFLIREQVEAGAFSLRRRLARVMPLALVVAAFGLGSLEAIGPMWSVTIEVLFYLVAWATVSKE